MTMNDLELNFSAFENADDASNAILNDLQRRFGFDLWMTTRTTEPDWIVLQSSKNNYGVAPGDVFRWADSFCSRMVKGEGPCIALNSNEVPAYLAAEIGQQVEINAYIGVPIEKSNGELFGTLCAIDPKPQQTTIEYELPLIQLYSRLLGTIIDKELLQAQQERLINHLRHAADRDSLTGLLNRRGWETAVNIEALRHQRYGSPLSIFILDLDELKLINDNYGHEKGDELIQATAQSLQACIRDSDIVARIGGDEFAVMTIECAPEASHNIYDAILEKMRQENINVSLGMAIHQPRDGISDTIRAADEAMYAMKRRNRANSNPN